MKIVILDYSSCSVDFITTNENEIEKLCEKYKQEGYDIGDDINEKTDFILSHHCNYKLDEIYVMSSDQFLSVNKLTLNDF